jgi:tetratricopeptide (TPR) repeat protein
MNFRLARFGALLLLVALALGIFAQSERATVSRLYRERRFTEAARVLETYLATNPSDYSSRLLLGLCYQQAGENYNAEAVFKEAVKQRPEHADARFYLARVEYQLSRFTEAEQNALLSIKLGGNAARAYNQIGLILVEKNENERALEAYDGAIRSDPNSSEPYANAGVLLLKLGRPSDALRYLSFAIQLNPRLADAFYNRGRAYLALNKRQEADKDLEEAISLAGHEQARRLLARLRSGALQTSSNTTQKPTAELVPIRFLNVAQRAGIRFVLENHPTPDKHLIETMPGGIAAFDYNDDGLTDIYFTNGANVPSLQKDSPKYFNRLYRNDGGMKFTDVTAEAGVAGAGYSMGAAVADYDNDGYADLFVAGVNHNILFHNRGNGSFEDVTARAGIRSDKWSVAAGWFDYDNDGLLDLFVVNYVNWSPQFGLFCGNPTRGLRVYCHPKHFQGLSNTLYRNRGDGTFEEVSEQSGIAAHVGKGMSVAFADYDQDGFMDVFVANDTLPNFLFHNRGNGTFEEVGLTAGVGLTDDGNEKSNMGADFRDYDNDGLPDLVVTALAGEGFSIFRNQGRGMFRDATYPSRMGLLSATRSGWSDGLFDFNNDGWKDLFTANSHVMDNVERFKDQEYKQANSIYANQGDGMFRDVSDEIGEGFRVPRAHRGSAFADFNNDGRMDIVVSSLGTQAELWENVTRSENHWIVLKLEGTRSNRDGIGARIKLGNQYNHMTASVGYASSSSTGAHFGLGRADLIDRLEILWPSGTTQVITNVKPDQILKVWEPRQ